jgi:hypothetical protein
LDKYRPTNSRKVSSRSSCSGEALMDSGMTRLTAAKTTA